MKTDCKSEHSAGQPIGSSITPLSQATKVTMDELSQTYRKMRLELRLHRKVWDVYSKECIADLNRYYDAMQQKPPEADLADSQPELCALGKSIEQECLANHQTVTQRREQMYATLRQSLTVIGKHFGGLMANDLRGTRLERFQRYWREANLYRVSHLDGITQSSFSLDTSGPMFVAFSREASYASAKLFWNDLNREALMRSGGYAFEHVFMSAAGWESRMQVLNAAKCAAKHVERRAMQAVHS